MLDDNDELDILYIGNVYEYRKTENSKPKLVYIINGQYMGSGGVSNCWGFRYVFANGKLSKKTDSDYDNMHWKFKIVKEARVEITIKLPYEYKR